MLIARTQQFISDPRDFFYDLLNFEKNKCATGFREKIARPTSKTFLLRLFNVSPKNNSVCTQNEIHL